MGPDHHYALTVEWTGDRGTGTTGYRGYGRDHVVRAEGVPDLLGSADPTFRGDRDRWNPELLLLAALSQCHMLSFLHVCVTEGVVVTGYRDAATASMRLHPDGSGEFTEAVLHPGVRVAAGHRTDLDTLHHRANQLCFIARSVAFPVRHEPLTVEVAEG
ncbi:OsmC family protein [Auraticoccus monumenti]|uniref:Organic hydroperoxide reductase OsmC/OhrA n=1 Tax=Auraticoccus monumenti TaxID=675864 RepID=A0A1G7BFK3_9ACTN|nr:OsmC family protein [Auraticoccus monumenti]SDE25520.1 Organic hydroperoxide reductase OsmC/OhrA [Auraticoccus monumenti]